MDTDARLDAIGKTLERIANSLEILAGCVAESSVKAGPDRFTVDAAIYPQ